NYIYQWNFTVNGPYGLIKHNTSNKDSFDVSLNYPGAWTGSLVVTNPGCSDTVNSPLYIVPGPKGSFWFVPDTGCSPLAVTFHVDSAQNSTYIEYDFGNG